MAFQAAWLDPLDGRHLARNVGSEEVGECDGLPSLETQPNCVDITLKVGSAAEVACHFAVSGDRLPNHTEGHRLNGCDALSRKAQLRLGKDSTGVEASPNQDKLRRMNNYCRLQGLNRCPLAWELGTLPLNHLGFDVMVPYQFFNFFWKPFPVITSDLENIFNDLNVWNCFTF